MKKAEFYILIFSLFFSAAITVQRLSLPKKQFVPGGRFYTNYNNYVIFRNSYYHLIENKNLYASYPQLQWDLYKYSPTFALMFAPFALVPVWLGMFLWIFLNVFVLLTGIWQLGGMSKSRRVMFIVFIFLELLTAVENVQVNPLVAGLMIWTFVLLERGKHGLAALTTVLNFFIKIYGGVSVVLFLFYPKKLKSLFYGLVWFVLLLIIPLVVITPKHLIWQYGNWLHLLKWDHSVSIGLSVLGFLEATFGFSLTHKDLMYLGGILISLLPLLRVRLYRERRFRMLFLALIMNALIIFNYKAESATYIIAVVGVGLWFFSKQKHNWTDLVLIALVVLFTMLYSSDLYPHAFREFFKRYEIKVVPCLLVWLKNLYEIWSLKAVRN